MNLENLGKNLYTTKVRKLCKDYSSLVLYLYLIFYLHLPDSTHGGYPVYYSNNLKI